MKTYGGMVCVLFLFLKQYVDVVEAGTMVRSPGRGRRLFSTPQRTDGLWDPFNLLSNGYRG
jgi:hypothetical protein